ncbi:RpiB/LacA/LacB family sugar-phosphate isomerase [Candidatus Peribacteria bacterium]|nr:RpiB/LacA/LacB family sugar-phosphate isomerase [Candidatus Peribacteria bacterium]
MEKQRVVFATDHAGFPLKETLKAYVTSKGMDVTDLGTFSEDAVDYPPVMRKGAAAVLEYGCLGVFLGGSGNGEAMAANKVRGIRAAVVWSEESARLARAHNDANVMCLGGRLIAPEDAKQFVDVFLSTKFEGGRHVKRVNDLEDA